jgi:curved DNA-binding protein CbpA
MRTLYDLLGVRPDADDEALNKAYRQAAKAHHPDLNAGDPDAGRRFRQIATAVEILRDAEQRAAYDRLLDGERQREHQYEREQRRARWTRIIIADAIAAVVLIVVLVGGYALIGPTLSTSTTVSKVENRAASGPVAKVEELETTGGDESRRRLEQGLAVVAASEQSAAAEREAALRREQEERQQAAERERQAERAAALRREREERQQAAERERQAAEREAALRREQEERRQAAEFERQKAEREAALRLEREEHKARQLAAIPEAARSATPTPSQAVQGAQTGSSAASPRNLGPAEIAATRAFTRF